MEPGSGFDNHWDPTLWSKAFTNSEKVNAVMLLALIYPAGAETGFFRGGGGKMSVCKYLNNLCICEKKKNL